MRAITKRMHEPDVEDELYRAFKVFDKDGDGYITVPELRHLMTNMGEKLTDAEIRDMIKVADLDEKGKVNFEGKVIKKNLNRYMYLHWSIRWKVNFRLNI